MSKLEQISGMDCVAMMRNWANGPHRTAVVLWGHIVLIHCNNNIFYALNSLKCFIVDWVSAPTDWQMDNLCSSNIHWVWQGYWNIKVSQTFFSLKYSNFIEWHYNWTICRWTRNIYWFPLHPSLPPSSQAKSTFKTVSSASLTEFELTRKCLKMELGITSSGVFMF